MGLLKRVLWFTAQALTIAAMVAVLIAIIFVEVAK